ADRMVRCDGEVAWCGSGRPGGAIGQDKTGDPVSERGLADPFRSANQQRVRHTSAAPGIENFAFRLGMAVKSFRLARMRGALEPVGLVDVRRHALALGAEAACAGRRNLSDTCIQMRTAMASALGEAS